MAAVRVGYVAFSEDKATEISEIAKVGKITPDTFGPSYEYVPLTDEPGTDVEKAIFSLALPQVAVKPTEWFILKIIMRSLELMTNEERLIFLIFSLKPIQSGIGNHV